MDRRALVVGVTGIQGGTLARRLVANGWEVTGLARRPAAEDDRIALVAADLLEPVSVAAAVGDLDPTHVFFNSWSRQATEAENIEINGAMLRNLLAALDDARSLKHVALVTGLKHYLGPFEAYAKIKPDTPFREDQPRLDYPNFYYAQEDILFAAAERHDWTWSVHRPHTVIGWAIGNAMNMGVTLAVYGTICRESGRPFVFPGPEQYNAATDVTGSTILAAQLEGPLRPRRQRTRHSTSSTATCSAGVACGASSLPGSCRASRVSRTSDPARRSDGGRRPRWEAIVERHGLRPYPIEVLASWWHTDADLGRTIETFTDMSKSRRLGFLEHQETPASFNDLFDRLRAERVIPTYA